jgi:hypothetical protein
VVVLVGRATPLDNPHYAIAVAEAAPRQPHTAAEMHKVVLPCAPIRSGGLPAVFGRKGNAERKRRVGVLVGVHPPQPT